MKSDKLKKILILKNIFSIQPIWDVNMIDVNKATIRTAAGCELIRRDRDGHIINQGLEHINTEGNLFYTYEYYYYQNPLYITCKVYDTQPYKLEKKSKKLPTFKNYKFKYCSLEIRYYIKEPIVKALEHKEKNTKSATKTVKLYITELEHKEENTELAKRVFHCIEQLYLKQH